MIKLNIFIVTTLTLTCFTSVQGQEEIKIAGKTELVRDVRGVPSEFFSFSDLVFGKVTHPQFEWVKDEKEFCIYGTDHQKALQLNSESVQVTKLIKFESDASPTTWKVYTGSIKSCVLGFVISGRICSTDGTPKNAYYDMDFNVETKLEDVVWDDLEALSGEKKDLTRDFIRSELEDMINFHVREARMEDIRKNMATSARTPQMYSIALAALQKPKRERSLDREL